MLVKICGVTTPRDAELCARLGVDAVGLVFAKGSRRRVDEGAAREIVAALSGAAVAVGVFVDTRVDDVIRTARAAGLTAVQLHGREPEADLDAVRASGLCAIKALAVGDEPLPFDPYPRAELLLLDAPRPGGGARFAWTRAAAISRRRAVILAGGLDPGNVGEGVRLLRPRGVDVSSGVERSPGVKDPARVAAFVRAVRAAEREVA